MKLPWRICICGHVVTAHALYMGGIPHRVLPWCAGAEGKCLCPSFRDRSLRSSILWTAWRIATRLTPGFLRRRA